MPTDAELLRAYAEEKSEEAFRELVRRQVNLVYSIALRQCGGDAHLAEDVAQRVFTDLARKASSLSGYTVLGGWLYRRAQFVASDIVRAEHRRRAREQEAQAMQEISRPTVGDADWQKLAPVLDEAIGQLPEHDRDAVVLRCIEARPFAEIGATLRLTEDAARMRVERALDKLRGTLGRRGITSTGTALGVALANQAGVAAPAGLAASVTGAVLAGGAGGSAGGALALFTMTKLQTAALVALCVTAALTVAWERQQTQAIAAEVAALRTERATLFALQQENRRLAGAIPQRAGGAQSPSSAAVRASNRAPLDETTEALLAAGMKPFASWKNQGRATPAAALETLLWAGLTRDFDALAPMIAFDDRGKAKLDAWFLTLAPELRAKLGTAERAIAPAFAVGYPWFQRFGSLGAQSPRVAYKLVGVSEPDRGGTVTLHVLFSTFSDPDRPEEIWLQPGPDGWRCGRMVESMVASFTDRIDPVTGALRPESRQRVSSP